MTRNVTVIIRDDPQRSHRAVEALRIALGLGAGENEVSVMLFDRAPSLLSEDRDDIVDVDILEKYLPSFQQLGTPFLVPQSTRSQYTLEEGFSIHELPLQELQRRIAASDHVLVF